jgi:branched-chain amino acid transport system permease protein
MRHTVDVVMSGLFAASVYFLVAAGLQVIFGVQRVLNLASGSFYAVGAFVGVSVAGWAGGLGVPAYLLPLALVAAGASVGVLGLAAERLLRTVRGHDEAFQLLLTFALVLVLEDAIRLVWGPAPRSTGNLYLVYGKVHLAGATVPVYNLMVIGVAFAVAGGLALVFSRTAFGRIVRAAAENPEMAEALGVDPMRLRARVFLLGTVLSTVGGALVIPSTATQSEMGIELIVVAFAVVVIGGLGSMAGAAVGALVVGLTRALAVSVWPEVDLIMVYLVVIAVLVVRPQGLFGQRWAVIER